MCENPLPLAGSPGLKAGMQWHHQTHPEHNALVADVHENHDYCGSCCDMHQQHDANRPHGFWTFLRRSSLPCIDMVLLDLEVKLSTESLTRCL